MDSEAQQQETNASAFTCHIQNHLNTISGVLPIENLYMFFPNPGFLGSLRSKQI